ncbi:MAG: pitrilysin family protein [Acidiferrobacteraceae bacterium]|jgi:zinc protease
MSFARLVFVLLLLAPAVGRANPDIQHWKLKNGVRVLFVESHELPMVRVRVIFDAGSARDEPGKEGQALLTNHLLSDGTATLDEDAVAQRFDSLGADLSTNVDRDMATIGLRSLSKKELLSPALETLRQLLMAPAFPAGGLERERGRMLVGFAQRAQSPDSVANRAFFHALYGNHPYAHRTVGTPESVRGIKREDLENFYKRYYVGGNALLVMVGDLKKSEAQRIARTLVGSLPKGERAPKLPPVPDLKKAVTRDIVFPSTQTHVLVGAPGVYRGDPDYFPLYVGNYILGGGGLVSRLSTEVREKRGLSYSVYSYFYPLRVKGPFVAGLETRTKQRLNALRVLRETMARFIEKGPTEEELVAAKRHITGGFPLRIDTSGKVADYLSVIGFYRLPLDYLDEFNRRVEAVTVKQIADAFRRRLDPKRMVTVTVGAKG